MAHLFSIGLYSLAYSCALAAYASPALAAEAFTDAMQPASGQNQGNYVQVTQYGAAADGYGNGKEFDAYWKADRITFGNGSMRLQIDDEGCAAGNCGGYAYNGAEWRSLSGDIGYGCYGVTMQAAAGSGLLSSFFFYADNADEIDIEIMGKDPTKLEATYFLAGSKVKTEVLDLGFDSSQKQHNYQIDRQADYIAWIVDGKEIYRVSEGQMPAANGQLMANIWAGKQSDWFGPRTFTSPSVAVYSSISYSPKACAQTSAQTSPPPAAEEGKQCYCVKG